MATYKIKKKTANGSTEEILLPISSIDGLQSALDGKQASGSYATTSQVNAKYTKPSGGIPKTDLASAVQTSLGKADTALQSYTETDPTVPSWAKASSKPSYAASEISGLATVATSGKYSDLSGKPTIPTVNNGTLTITENGVSKGTFSANQSGNTTIALTNTTYQNASTTAAGLMSAADKIKINYIEYDSSKKALKFVFQ